ncbi:IS630 family transposase [Nonomuraea terrae]|uniref:IS630 family transposase n=2 Tax=Nonomuraea terrae TaxID=2530383 RepID=A0A4R4YXM7_9ACTN|nr:IS630 family transposase [Nonomuraea terrae]TDD49710.1 IS630 family transposase [Nonomuraea terrae]
MARLGRRASFEERLRACQLIESGKSPDLVAEILGFGRATVFGWLQDYRALGPEGLRTKKTRGPAARLDDAQLARLYALIAGHDPRQLSFGFALWTRAMVAELIRREFKVKLSLVSVGRVLAKLGMSPQRPLYRAYQQDPAAVAEWKQHTFPAIAAEAKRLGAAVFFADEAAVRTDYHAGTTWAPIGRTPVVATTGARRSVMMISAVSPRGELRFQLFDQGLDADAFIGFCKRLLADTERPVFLIVDNSRVHRAKKVKAFVEATEGRLSLFFLPPYSPELNPDEWVWKNVKHDRIARASARGAEELKSLALGALRRLQKLPALVRSFFADPHLAYIGDSLR